MSTDNSDSASRFATKLKRAHPVEGQSRHYIEALVAEVESLSNALVERDKRLVEAGISIMKEDHGSDS